MSFWRKGSVDQPSICKNILVKVLRHANKTVNTSPAFASPVVTFQTSSATAAPISKHL